MCDDRDKNCLHLQADYDNRRLQFYFHQSPDGFTQGGLSDDYRAPQVGMELSPLKIDVGDAESKDEVIFTTELQRL